jgi:hypothetical protein
MAIISFDEDEIIEYIPIQERENKNPCTVLLRFMPFKKVQKYSRALTKDFRKESEGEKDFYRLREIREEIEQAAQRKQFIENVVEIKNYSIKGQLVTDPGRFYDTADTDLIVDIMRAMQSAQQLSEGQKKTSSGPSDGA